MKKKEPEDSSLIRMIGLIRQTISEGQWHGQNMDVVRLAVDLARLRDQKEPGPFLGESARLLAEARHAIQHEAERPEREKQATVEQLAKQLRERLKDAYKEKLVPFGSLCLPEGFSGIPPSGEFLIPKESILEIKEMRGEDWEKGYFTWKLYRDEGTFRKLVFADCAKRSQEEFEKLRAWFEVFEKQGTLESNWRAIIRKEFQGEFWFTKKHEARIEKTQGTLRRVIALVRAFQREALPKIQTNAWSVVKADKCTLADVYRLHLLQKERKKRSGPKPKKGAESKDEAKPGRKSQSQIGKVRAKRAI